MVGLLNGIGQPLVQQQMQVDLQPPVYVFVVGTVAVSSQNQAKLLLRVPIVGVEKNYWFVDLFLGQ